MKARPFLSLTLPTAPRASVGVLATNEAETHRPGFVKLTAGGLSDSVMPSRTQTHDKTFDVSPASALHNFVVASTRSASEGIDSGKPIAINGIWALSPGNVSPSNSDPAAAPAAEVYFTAGPHRGSGGLFGYVTAVSTELTEGNSQWYGQ